MHVRNAANAKKVLVNSNGRIIVANEQKVGNYDADNANQLWCYENNRLILASTYPDGRWQYVLTRTYITSGSVVRISLDDGGDVWSKMEFESA